MDKELKISIGESARLGQAINLAMNLKMSVMEEGSVKPKPKVIRDLVFSYTLPLIEAIRKEYVKRRDEVLTDTEDKMYEGCMNDSGFPDGYEGEHETKVVL